MSGTGRGVTVMAKITKGDSRGVFYDLFEDDVDAAHLTMRGNLLVELLKQLPKKK